ncbi:XdhC family protein [Indioceanicola profundi]|uniref:XdhC family protein n=1 Tax=Indioceanicola profundi TaxID=2220096 RepID=UPI001CED2FC2|nr:XdhC family protein [Indioceanicola profundi]
MTGALSAILRQWIGRGEPAVLVTVAAARGSTPREAGAAMLVGQGTWPAPSAAGGWSGRRLRGRGKCWRGRWRRDGWSFRWARRCGNAAAVW